MSDSDYPALAILGPTASGKSQLALSLAGRFAGEIVTCDALQIYRGMDIGTAKPTPAERERIAHHLLDLRGPGEEFSAGDFMRLGREALQSIAARRKLPVVTGGTGFYMRALTDGLFEGPGRSDALRARMRRIAARRGSAALHRLLGRADAASAARIAPGDLGRVLRALEVWFLSGKPMSWWQEQPRDRLRGFRWLKLGLAWPREELYARIDRRTVEMFECGFLEEVRGLLLTCPRECQAFKAIGYRQAAEYIEGRISLENAMEEMQQQSRNYAKRQLTWFRADPGIRWLDAGRDWESVEEEACGLVQGFIAGTERAV